MGVSENPMHVFPDMVEASPLPLARTFHFDFLRLYPTLPPVRSHSLLPTIFSSEQPFKTD